MDYRDYVALRGRLVPGLRFNQDFYAETLDACVTPETRWLDAGCGHQIIPHHPQWDARLTSRARLVVGCDLDEPAMRKHRAIRRIAAANLEALPYRTGTFTLVSANTVVEHLKQPAAVFREFVRVLAPGGQFLLHTPNAYSYFVLGARLLPDALIRRLDGRAPEDIFPTHYRANTPRRIRRLLSSVGFRNMRCRMIASDATHQRWRVLTIAELCLIRATMTRLGRPFRVSMIVTATRCR